MPHEHAAEPVDQQVKVDPKAYMTPQPAEELVVNREERIEYRDQDGNLLDDEQVKKLAAEGGVSFQTKYETRTRLVDQDGNEIQNYEGVAPDHPDVEGQNPDTKGLPEDQASEHPAHADVSMAGGPRGVDDGRPRPASEAQEATK